MRKVFEFKNAADLPKESGEYLCYVSDSKDWIVLQFSSRHGLFNAFDDWTKKEAKKTAIHITYWAALPEEL